MGAPGGPPQAACPQALLLGHSPDLGSPCGAGCEKELGGTCMRPSCSGGAPPSLAPARPPARTWEVAGGLEASASPGAWDPAELERVGPIGRDFESQRGAAPGTRTRTWGPAQPALPVLQSHPLLLAGACQPHTLVRGQLDSQPTTQLDSNAPPPWALWVTRKGWLHPLRLSRAEDAFRKPSPTEQGPAASGSDLTLPDIPTRPTSYTLAGVMGVWWGGGQRSEASEVCCDKGRPSALWQMPKVGQALRLSGPRGSAWEPHPPQPPKPEVSPTPPVSPRSPDADTTFCKHFSVFI